MFADSKWSWLVLAGGFICYLHIDGISFMFGYLKDDIRDHFNLVDGKDVVISTIGTISHSTMFFIGPLVAQLINVIGTRVPCMLGALLCSTGLVASAFVPNIKLMGLTYGLLCGLGFGLMVNASVVAVGHYFDKGRAMAIGILTSGAGFGKIALPQILHLVSSTSDLKGTLLVLAGMCLFCTLCGLAMVPIETNLTATPKETEKSRAKCILNALKKLTSLFLNAPFIILLIGQLFAFSGSVLPYYFLPNMAETRGVDARMLVTTIGIGDITFRVLTGLAISSLGINPLLLSSLTLAFCAGVPVAMTQCQSYWSFMVTSALFGVFHAPYAASVAVAITDLCGISSLATAFGMLQFVYGIGVVLGVLTSSHLQDMTGILNAPFYISGSFLFLASLLHGTAWFIERQTSKHEYDEISDSPTYQDLKIPDHSWMSSTLKSDPEVCSDKAKPCP